LSWGDARSVAGEPGGIDFARQIRPILSNRCFVCHGPDEGTRQADLRLDRKEDALADRGGYRAIEAGKPDESELVTRITSADEDLRMPPAGKEPLAEGEIALIRRWIEAGASWNDHWAFIKPESSPVPTPKRTGWARNPIDNFVLARLESEGLAPSPEADKTTLLRRVTLDLTGLPPTLAEVDAFLADDSPEAYEKVVDRLLASPRYGEHGARYWLDAARYGDTHGLHLDNERSMWLYRDWVIKALNDNMPFDRFTVEQMAGDLMPEATLEQRIASGFNRCNVTTSEGGAIDDEFLMRYSVDRVETTGTVWLGLTVGCAACHDHKFDPISQKEFYQLYAFFNSTAEKAMDGNALLPAPVVRAPSPEQARRQQELEVQLAAVEAEIREAVAGMDYEDPVGEKSPELLEPRDFVWIDEALPPGAKPEGDGADPFRLVSLSRPAHQGRMVSTRTTKGRSQHFFTGARPELVIGQGDVLFAHVFLDPADPPREIMLQWNDGSWEHRAFWGEDVIDWGSPDTPGRRRMGDLPEAGKWVRLEIPAAKVGLEPGAKVNGWAFTQFDGTVCWDTAGVCTRTPQGGEGYRSQRAWELAAGQVPALPAPVRETVKKAAEARSESERKQLRDYFVEYILDSTRGVFEPLHGRRDELKSKAESLEKEIPATLVSEELPQPRPAHVMKRGQYDQPGELVERNVPAVLPPFPADAPRNRLGLAQWLVGKDNPLPARVAVNRYWQRYFGVGLVKTSDDFGSQGEQPSHPELLDWLAVDFQRSGWDVKRFQRLIVTSATYRQSSKAEPARYAADPENRLLARGPRFRLDAETIRDNALAVSGLLAGPIGGPSVRPYQPPGIWEAVGYTTSNTARFTQDHGEALYRRSLYTFWKRTAPPPSLQVFDAPSRETCTVRRSRTNSPLAALALLNDVQYFEAARVLAQRILREAGRESKDRAAWAFRLVTARQPSEEELAILVRLFEAGSKSYGEDPESARKTIAVGESPSLEGLDPVELAAWTLVANCLLNLDETITKN
ncbi:MAG: PSD1 and planctomycete cytochrome C domain-containing protein, partial [Thermoguttaceae bacterium]